MYNPRGPCQKSAAGSRRGQHDVYSPAQFVSHSCQETDRMIRTEFICPVSLTKAPFDHHGANLVFEQIFPQKKIGAWVFILLRIALATLCPVWGVQCPLWLETEEIIAHVQDRSTRYQTVHHQRTGSVDPGNSFGWQKPSTFLHSQNFLVNLTLLKRMWSHSDQLCWLKNILISCPGSNPCTSTTQQGPQSVSQLSQVFSSFWWNTEVHKRNRKSTMRSHGGDTMRKQVQPCACKWGQLWRMRGPAH